MAGLKHFSFCFSQTGNTKKLAEAISGVFSDRGHDSEVRPIPKSHPENAREADVIGVGTPVHYWTLPLPVDRWLDRLPQGEGKPAYAFTTYGHVYGGNTLYELARALSDKGYRLVGGVQAPAEHNYPTLQRKSPEFGKGTPGRETISRVREYAGTIVEKAEKEDAEVPVGAFHNRRSLLNLLDSLVPMSSKIGSMPDILFERESCVGCGTCTRLCPLSAIQIVGGRALRGKECIKCWQCVEHCEGKALKVEYEGGERVIRMAKRMASVPRHELLLVE